MDGAVGRAVEVRLNVHFSEHVFCVLPAGPIRVCEKTILGMKEFRMVIDELGRSIVKFLVPAFIPI